MPVPATIERLRGLVLSAQDLRALTKWPDALIEDYLNIVDNFITLAELLDIEIDQTIEEVPTNFADGSIPFADDGFLIEENPGLVWDNVAKILTVIGTIIGTDLIATATTTSPIVYGGDATTEDLELHSNPIKDGLIKLGDNSAYDEDNDRLYINAALGGTSSIQPGLITEVAKIIKLLAGQTADAFQILSSTDATMYAISPSGDIKGKHRAKQFFYAGM